MSSVGLVSVNMGAKVRAVRWEPSGRRFFAGSWDEAQNQLFAGQVVKEASMEEDADEGEIQPRIRIGTRLNMPGDVVALACPGEALAAAALGDGSVCLVQRGAEDRLSVASSWDALFPGPAAGLSLMDSELVVASEGGCLAQLSLDHPSAVRRLNAFDGPSASPALAALDHVAPGRVVSGNQAGQVCLWDFREPSQTGSVVAEGLFGGGGSAVLSLGVDPSASHLVAFGTADGRLRFLDLRRGGPVALQLPAGPLWALRFHPSSPRQLFAGGADGALLQLDATAASSGWADGGAAEAEVTSLLDGGIGAVNAIDAVGDAVLAATDADALHLLHGFCCA